MLESSTTGKAPKMQWNLNPNASLHISDIDPLVGEAQLYSIFSDLGKVQSIRIARDPVTRISLGFGAVTFADEIVAAKVLESHQSHGLVIHGHTCRISPFNPDISSAKNGPSPKSDLPRSPTDSRPHNSENCCIFIKNLDPQATDAELAQVFKPFGTIVLCSVARDPIGTSRGFAYIIYDSAHSATVAMERMNNVVFKDRLLQVGPHMSKWAKVQQQKANFTNLFIRNIAPDVNLTELQSLLAQFGETTSLSFPTEPESHSFKGYGFVSYKSHDEAVAAIKELNGYDLHNRTLHVSRAQTKSERDQDFRKLQYSRALGLGNYQSCNLYINNLDANVTHDVLHEAFSPFGTITSARVMQDSEGKCRGFGFVCFSSPIEAQSAILAMSQQLLYNKRISVSLAQKKDSKHKSDHHHHNSAFKYYIPALNPAFAAYYYQNAQSGASPSSATIPLPPHYALMARQYAADQTSEEKDETSKQKEGAIDSKDTPSTPPQNTLPAANQSVYRVSVPYVPYPFYLPPSPHLGFPAPESFAMAGFNEYVSSRNTDKNRKNSSFSKRNSITHSNSKLAAGGSKPKPPPPQENYGSTLAAALASAATPQAEKQVIGEALFPQVLHHEAVQRNSTLAGKLTGVLLNQDASDLITWIDDPEIMKEKIQQAYDAYSDYLAKALAEKSELDDLDKELAGISC